MAALRIITSGGVRGAGQGEELNCDAVIMELWSWDGPAELSNLEAWGQGL